MSYSSSVVGGKLKLKRPGGAPAAAVSAVARPAAVVPPAAKPVQPPPVVVKSSAPATTESLAGTKRKAEEADASSAVAQPAKVPRLDKDEATEVAEKSSVPEAAAPSSSSAPAKVVKVEDLGLKGLTASERAHAERMLQRKAELAKKDALKTHRERVADMNAHLARLPEHNDLFRISYAGTG